MLQTSFKNRPIWSHWVQLIQSVPASSRIRAPFVRAENKCNQLLSIDRLVCKFFFYFCIAFTINWIRCRYVPTWVGTTQSVPISNCFNGSSCCTYTLLFDGAITFQCFNTMTWDVHIDICLRRIHLSKDNIKIIFVSVPLKIYDFWKCYRYSDSSNSANEWKYE